MSTFISLAYNFWSLTRNAINEMEENNNRSNIFSDVIEKETEDESWSKYEEKTKWNDNNIGIPILFNFYHGLELYMKGLLIQEGISFNANHKLKSLYEIIKTNENKYSKEIIDLLKKHIHNSDAYNPFFLANESDIESFYECFRYPENKKGDISHYYGCIRGKEKKTLLLYQELSKATIEFKQAIINWKSKIV